MAWSFCFCLFAPSVIEYGTTGPASPLRHFVFWGLGFFSNDLCSIGVYLSISNLILLTLFLHCFWSLCFSIDLLSNSAPFYEMQTGPFQCVGPHAAGNITLRGNDVVGKICTMMHIRTLNSLLIDF